jgi:nitrate reductase alpha subunit
MRWGEFMARAKVSPCVQPGQVIIYHSGEPYQFPRWLNQNTVTATPIKVTNMVGDYGHLQYRMAYYSPNHIPKEAAVEVEKV